MANYTRPKYAEGYEIRYNCNSDQFECWRSETLLSKKDGKPASYKALGLATKFMSASGAQEVPPELPKWTPPPPAQIAPLAEQLAALSTDARFVLIEAGYGTYREQGYACYDREKQAIVCPYTYNGWNFVTADRAKAEAEVAYRQENPPEKIEPDEDILNALVETEEAWENRFSRPSPEPAPTSTNETEIEISTHEQVGSLVKFEGRQWLVTRSEYLSSADADEAEEGFDVFLSAGWHTTLVHLDPDVMTVLSEQHKAGQAQFPARDMVKFPDEEWPIKLTDLRYSEKIGLYDGKRTMDLDAMNDLNVKAHRMLAEKLAELGVDDALVIWPDEGRAYLDSGSASDYEKVAAHFGLPFDPEDKGDLNDCLWRRYSKVFADLKDAEEA